MQRIDELFDRLEFLFERNLCGDAEADEADEAVKIGLELMRKVVKDLHIIAEATRGWR